MEIGSTLRETRIRRKISIETVEEATKIRAKYLRALENEEWDLLPGRAYVPSFLRTYAQVLGLDSQVLIDSYRAQEEAAREGGEQYGLTEPVLRRQGRRGADTAKSSPLRLGRGPVVGLGVVLLLASLFALGRWGAGDEDPDRATTETAAEAEESDREEQIARRRQAQEAERRRREEQRRQVSTVSVQATGPLYVCLQDATGELPVTGATLEAGDSLGPFRSRGFRLVLGNNNVELAVDGEGVDVEASAAAIGYEIRAGREPAPLDSEDFPECQ